MTKIFDGEYQQSTEELLVFFDSGKMKHRWKEMKHNTILHEYNEQHYEPASLRGFINEKITFFNSLTFRHILK